MLFVLECFVMVKVVRLEDEFTIWYMQLAAM